MVVSNFLLNFALAKGNQSKRSLIFCNILSYCLTSNSFMRMQKKSLREFVCAEIQNGTFGVVINTETEPRMRKTNNPYFGRVRKITRMTNVAIGYNYENVVNARLGREGKENDFQAEKPNGKHWVCFPNILASDKDESQLYLRTTMRKNTESKSVYTLDGQVVTDTALLAEIKSFIYTSSKPTNQGLNEGNEVIVRDFKLENVVSLTQGAKEWHK